MRATRSKVIEIAAAINVIHPARLVHAVATISHAPVKTKTASVSIAAMSSGCRDAFGGLCGTVIIAS
jgi:hypothetical protein